MVKTFDANPPPLLQLDALPEHFDYLEAVPAECYYDKGISITVKVQPLPDGLLNSGDNEKHMLHQMKRQILRTDTCDMEIPELQFSSPEGKAKFATVMEFLEEVEMNLQFMTSGLGSQLKALLAALEEMKMGKRAFTIRLKDPLGNSCAQIFDSSSTAAAPPVQQEQQADKKVAANEAPTLVSDFNTLITSDPCVQYSFFERNRVVNSKFDIPELTPWVIKKGEEEGIPELVKLIQSSSNIVGFTGAGISTESGIPAFRSANKNEKTIWNTYDMSDSVFEKYKNDEETRIRSWQMYHDLSEFVVKAQPNGAHKLFKFLEDKGKLEAVITQNIDELHQKAQVTADKVIELHGSSRRIYCMQCKKIYNNCDEILLQEFPKILKANNTSPRCTHCDNGILKFDTIYFGEPLKPQVVQKAITALEKADLVIVMGSALVVAPANNMVTSCLDRNVPVVMINIGETFIDEFVNVLINQKCGQVCDKVMQMLGNS